jgi:hypothetical protein
MRKILFFAIVSLSVFWVACGTVKPTTKPTNKDETLGEIQSTIVFNPKTGKYDTIYVRNNKIDTVNWKPAPPKTKPPIGGEVKPNSGNNTNSQGGVNIPAENPSQYDRNGMPLFIKPPRGTKMKQQYNLAFLLPFFTDKFSSIDNDVYDKSLWALNFYAGAKMALDSLESEGISLKVNVLDTKANEAQLVLSLATDAVQNADVIIGTETNANVKTAADFAKLNKKVLISPYNPASDLVFDNPQFIQLNPSLRTNCEAIMRQIRKEYRPEQIVLICRDKTNEKEAMQYLQLENQKLSNNASPRLREIIIDEKQGLVGIDIKGSMTSEAMVFVIPIWGQNSESFIYTLLNKINSSKGKKTVTVYGMPQWANFQVNGYDAFEPLNVHITQPFYVDRVNTTARGFSVSYFEKYAAAPADESFTGYDLTLYVGRMLKRYGTKFNDILDLVPFNGLQSSFNFERESNVSNAFNATTFDRYANKSVNILKFENGCFNKIN